MYFVRRLDKTPEPEAGRTHPSRNLRQVGSPVVQKHDRHNGPGLLAGVARGSRCENSTPSEHYIRRIRKRRYFGDSFGDRWAPSANLLKVSGHDTTTLLDADTYSL